ncbi:hypothetical protein SEA_NOSHOW_75 [Mycobacterium phage NoShow]|nr:hypothetical protein SEA_NOSHOW_75 [Mycobacterium phage NoShow]
MNPTKERFVQVTETHTLRGDDTVRTAADLIGQLPNGWKLCSLEHKDGWWVAIVRGPRNSVT